MRLTLEETETHPGDARRSVTVEIDRDELDMPDMIDELIRPALLAMQYHPNTIAKFIGEKAEQPEPPAIIDPELQWQTRDGHRVTGVEVLPNNLSYPVSGWIDGNKQWWARDGKYLRSQESHFDLIPYEGGHQ